MKKKKKPDTAYRYSGDGFVYGVPRRDLTHADLQRVDLAALRNAVAAGLYTPVGDPVPVPPVTPPRAVEGEVK